MDFRVELAGNSEAAAPTTGTNIWISDRWASWSGVYLGSAMRVPTLAVVNFSTAMLQNMVKSPSFQTHASSTSTSVVGKCPLGFDSLLPPFHAHY